MFTFHKSIGQKISLRIGLELTFEWLCVGVMSDRDKYAPHWKIPFFLCRYVSQANGVHLALFIWNVLCDYTVPDRLDLWIGECTIGHDFRGAEFIAAVDEIHLGGESSQENGFLRR